MKRTSFVRARLTKQTVISSEHVAVAIRTETSSFHLDTFMIFKGAMGVNQWLSAY